MKWFREGSVSDLESLRKYYRKLVVKHHPDNGGSEEDIKQINLEYESLFQKIEAGYEKSESYAKQNDRQKQSYDTVKDEKIRDMVVKLSKYPGLVVEQCGVWLWISGDTKKWKAELKALGLHYASQKKCWYIHWDDFVRYGSRPSSMSYIRSKYGSTIVHAEQQEREAIRG